MMSSTLSGRRGCPLPLKDCPEQKKNERQGHPQGTTRQDVADKLRAMRLELGGDINDEGSPMNLRWRKYWADRGVSV